MGVARSDRVPGHAGDPDASEEENPTQDGSARVRIDLTRLSIRDVKKWLLQRLETELDNTEEVPMIACIAFLEQDKCLEPQAVEVALSKYIPSAAAAAVTTDFWKYLDSRLATSNANAEGKPESPSNGRLSLRSNESQSPASHGTDKDGQATSRPLAENEKAKTDKNAAKSPEEKANPHEESKGTLRTNGTLSAPPRDSVESPSYHSNRSHLKEVDGANDLRKDLNDKDIGNADEARKDLSDKGIDDVDDAGRDLSDKDADDVDDARKKLGRKDIDDADDVRKKHSRTDIDDADDTRKNLNDEDKPMGQRLGENLVRTEGYDLREAILSRSGRPPTGKRDLVSEDAPRHGERHSRSLSDGDDSRERRRRRRRRRREYDDEDEREYRRYRRRHRRRSRSLSRSPSPQRSPSEERDRERRREERRARRRERELAREERRRARKRRRHEDDISHDRDDRKSDEGDERIDKERRMRDYDESDYRRSRRKRRRRYDDREEGDFRSPDEFESNKYRDYRHHRRHRSHRRDRDDESGRRRRELDSRERGYSSGERGDRFYEDERDRPRDAFSPHRREYRRYERMYEHDDREIRPERLHGNGPRPDDKSLRHVRDDTDVMQVADARQRRAHSYDERREDHRDSRPRESDFRQSGSSYGRPTRYDFDRRERAPTQAGLSRRMGRGDLDHSEAARIVERQSSDTPWNAAAGVESSRKDKPSVRGRMQKKISALKLDHLRSKALASMGRKSSSQDDEKTIWNPKN